MSPFAWPVLLNSVSPGMVLQEAHDNVESCLRAWGGIRDDAATGERTAQAGVLRTSPVCPLPTHGPAPHLTVWIPWMCHLLT